MSLGQAIKSPALRRSAMAASLGGTGWYVWQRVISMTTLPPFAHLLAALADPGPGMEVYDPSAGVGMLLRAAHRAVPNGSVHLYGQELDPLALAVGRAVTDRGSRSVQLAGGDTLREPAFLDGDRLRAFDLVIANPVWDQLVEPEVWRADRYGRFTYGVPPREFADWGWVQHCIASLKPTGRVVMVVGAGALSRSAKGLGTDSERDIRAAIIDDDLVDAVVWCSPDDQLLAEGSLDRAVRTHLAQSAIVVLNRAKRSPGTTIMIDGSEVLRSQSFRPATTLNALVDIYRAGKPRAGATVVEIADLERSSYDLRPRQYLTSSAG